MSGHSAEEIREHLKIYYVVFGALAVLTGVTVAVAELHFLSVHAAIALALFVATIKGSLVACYFMHLISEKSAIFAILALCAILCCAAAAAGNHDIYIGRSALLVSLKAFHVFFVAMAIVLCLGMGVWGLGQYRSGGDKGSLYISVGSFAAGLFLGIYGLWFLRKLRNISYI